MSFKLVLLVGLVALAGRACAKSALPPVGGVNAPLPASRPPLWPFRGFAETAKWSCELNKAGAIMLDVEHLDIPGVTGDMVKWAYDGGLAESSPHPITGKVYQNYLLLHPREHNAHRVHGLPLAVKSTTHDWFEFLLTGCSQNKEAPGAPFVCPKGGSNKGLTAGVDPDTVQKSEFTNATTTVIENGKASVEIGVRACNEKEQCAWIVKTKQEWKDSPAGVKLHTTMQVGLNLGLAESRINPRIVDGWAKGSDPVQRCQRAALHYIEEWGATQYWLPQAYARAHPNGVAAASAAKAPASGLRAWLG